MATYRSRATSLAEVVRAFSRIDDATGCWIWTRAADALGYGLLRVEGRLTRAHRASFAAARGQIPDGLCVLHRCDRPSCVNPEHLFLGTRAENNADRTRKGRTSCGEEHVHRRLSESDVREIRTQFATGQWSPSALGKRYGVARSTVRAVVGRSSRTSWKHVQ
jgi:hypothetical protein